MLGIASSLELLETSISQSCLEIDSSSIHLIASMWRVCGLVVEDRRHTPLMILGPVQVLLRGAFNELRGQRAEFLDSNPDCDLALGLDMDMLPENPLSYPDHCFSQMVL